MRNKKFKLKQCTAFLLMCMVIFTSFHFAPTIQAKNKTATKTTYTGPGYQVSFKVTNSWTGTFNANVTIQNTSDKIIDNWALCFVMPHKITTIKNGKIHSKTEHLYIIKNTIANQDIPIGGMVQFSLSAISTENIQIPKSFLMLSNETEVEQTLYSCELKINPNWKTVYNGKITLTNKSDRVLEDWVMEFDYPYEISRFYNAILVSKRNNHYVIKNRGYNANIKAGKNVTLAFSTTPGNQLREITNIIVKEVIVDAKILKLDYDDDNLTNEMELMLGTSPNNQDTDGDGIGDYLELQYGLNPSLTDSDNNKVSDGDEDLDGDGLSIKKEFQYGTENLCEDTDGDGLTDYEEIYVYKTDPLTADTDGDGLEDGAEIKLGLNPLEQDSNKNGVLDGDERIKQTLSQEILLKGKKEVTSVSVTMEATGHLEKTTTIENTYEKDTLSSDVVGLVGVPVNITSSSQFEEATITFTYDETALKSIKEDNLRVMWYDEKNNQYVIMDEETILDTSNNTLSYKTTHFSTYLVVDRQAWYDVWNNAITYRRNPGNSQIPTEFFDICYVLDQSGSMSGTSIITAKEAIGNFIEAMYTEDRGAIVGFHSSATIYSEFTGERLSLKTALNSISANGGTSVESGLVKALHLFDSTPPHVVSNIPNSKMILLLCDGDVSYTNKTLDRAKELGIKIFPVLIGSTSGKSALQHIADTTGGKFYYASTAEDIRDAIFGVQEDTIGDVDTTDTDGDGLYDIYELGGMIISNGRYVYTDPLKNDTDSDSLWDSKEMGQLESYEEQGKLKQMILKMSGFDNEVYAEYFDYKSDPRKKDSDGDRYEDSKDPHPLGSDVTTVALKNSEKFVEIWDGSINYYGGDQSWYISKVAQDGACGTVAAANITAYMSRHSSDFSALYPYTDFSKDNFLAHMNDMYSFLSPAYIPFTEIPLGIWPMSKFENGVEKFAKDRGVPFKGVHDNSRFNKEHITEYITKGLQSDAPVAMLIGFNDNLKDIEVIKLNGETSIQSSFATHWVVITELTMDEITDKAKVKVSTWGKYSYLDLDSYLEGNSIYQCLLYFE